jgi:hypothetical protein
MAILSNADQQRAINAFFKAQVKNLETATAIGIKTTATKLKNETKKQLRQQFNVRNSSFAKSVKVYNLSARGALGPASYVRLGIPWIGIFEEGGEVTGKSNLLILLPEGAKLGFKRIKPGQWGAFWERNRANLFTKKVSDGTIVYFKKEEKVYPIYKFQKSVNLRKRLSFYETAEALSDEMADLISNLMG